MASCYLLPALHLPPLALSSSESFLLLVVSISVFSHYSYPLVLAVLTSPNHPISLLTLTTTIPARIVVVRIKATSLPLFIRFLGRCLSVVLPTTGVISSSIAKQWITLIHSPQYTSVSMAGTYGMLLLSEQQDGPHMPTGNPTPPPRSMAPPPSGQFSSRDELLEFQKEWAETQGFAVVIGRSRPNRLWIKCDRGGEYADKHLHDPENRKRKRKATRLTGCPFNVKATMKKDKIWRCHTETPEHNHPPSDDLTIHPSLRRMTDEQLVKVNEMTEAGNTPVETLDELKRLWPNIKVLRRDIYNARKKYKTEKELAEIAQGYHEPQPFEDPNGRMPGPTRTGRWEWVEDGDEIKRKKKKKASLTSNSQSNLAPELRDSHSPQLQQPATRRQAPGLGSLPPRTFQPAQPQASQIQAPSATPNRRAPEPDFTSASNSSAPSPGQFRHYNPNLTPPLARSAYHPPPQPSATDVMVQQQQPAARVRTGSEVAPMAPMISPLVNGASAGTNNGTTTGAGASTSASAGANAGGPKQPSGQVLMSRIERMEKEQNEQKQMLAQILSAVQGVGGLRR